jgi:hypothetical protein
VSQQINLYNPAFEHRKKLFGAAAMAQALALLLVGLALLTWYGNHNIGELKREAGAGERLLGAKQKQLDATRIEFAPRKKSPELEAGLVEAKAQLASLHRIAAVLERGELGNTEGYSEYLRALARQRVDGVWLTGLAIGAAGSEVNVRGRALDASLIPGYLAQLTREPVLQGKAFGSMQITRAQPLQAAGKDGKPSATAPSYVEFTLAARPEGTAQ